MAKLRYVLIQMRQLLVKAQKYVYNALTDTIVKTAQIYVEKDHTVRADQWLHARSGQFLKRLVFQSCLNAPHVTCSPWAMSLWLHL